jgi:hypothetical protein
VTGYRLHSGEQRPQLSDESLVDADNDDNEVLSFGRCSSAPRHLNPGAQCSCCVPARPMWQPFGEVERAGSGTTSSSLSSSSLPRGPPPPRPPKDNVPPTSTTRSLLRPLAVQTRAPQTDYDDNDAHAWSGDIAATSNRRWSSMHASAELRLAECPAAFNVELSGGPSHGACRGLNLSELEGYVADPFFRNRTV